MSDRRRDAQHFVLQQLQLHSICEMHTFLEPIAVPGLEDFSELCNCASSCGASRELAALASKCCCLGWNAPSKKKVLQACSQLRQLHKRQLSVKAGLTAAYDARSSTTELAKFLSTFL